MFPVIINLPNLPFIESSWVTDIQLVWAKGEMNLHPEKENIFRNFVKYFTQYTCLSKSEIVEVINKKFSTPIKSNIMTAYQSYRKEGIDEGLKLGKAEGKAEGIKLSISRLLLKGKLSIPDIADAMEVWVSYVVEIRDELLRSGAILLPLVRDF